MIGGELAAGAAIAGNIVKHAGKDIAAETKAVNKKLLEGAIDKPGFDDALESYANRIAVKQAILTSLFKPLAKMLGVSSHYFKNDFDRDMAEKLADVPEENIVAPKASIAAPAMQGLAFSLDEPDLKELYLNLLASASDDRVNEDVHPAFVEIVRQLSAEEAPYLSRILEEVAVACVRVKSQYKEEASKDGWTPVLDHVLDTPTEVRRLATFVDNWVRLGLADVQYAFSFMDQALYDWVESHPAVRRIKSEHADPEREITYDLGTLRATALGAQFAQAVGMAPAEDEQE